MSGDFKEATGGKGANTAAAAAQTTNGNAEFVGQFGSKSSNQNLFKDLATFGNVHVERCRILKGCATGTAYIMTFPDGDNCIALIGGANQQKWDCDSSKIKTAISTSSVIMLQREIPNEANVALAKHAFELGPIPVLLDC